MKRKQPARALLMKLPSARASARETPPPGGLRATLYQVIFGTDTPAGRLFDVLLLVVILASILVVMLESTENLSSAHGQWLYTLEWIFTGLFTAEYLLRLYSVARPSQYAFSFFGAIDLIAVLPTYVSLLLPGVQSLLILRVVRMLRVFRIFKMARFVGEAHLFLVSLRSSMAKITVFLGAVVAAVTITGALMYLLEGPTNGFTSIPRAMYWAVVTMTTVGYGDIAPQTVPGQFLASFLMVLGYGIIAVPTGIVSVEMYKAEKKDRALRRCPACAAPNHDADARFCKNCGARLGM